MALTKEQRQAYLAAIPEAERGDLLNASDEDLQEYAELCAEESTNREVAEAADKRIDAIIAAELGEDWRTNTAVMVPALLNHSDRAEAHTLAKEWGMEKEFQEALSKPLLGHAQRVEEQRSRQSCCIML